MNGVTAGLLVVLIVVGIWFYFQFKNLDPLSGLQQLAQAVMQWLQQLGDSLKNGGNSLENLALSSSPDTPVSTVGTGGGPGSVFGPQIFTGISSSEAAALQNDQGLTPYGG